MLEKGPFTLTLLHLSSTFLNQLIMFCISSPSTSTPTPTHLSPLPDVLRGYAQEVESQNGRHSRDTPSSFSGHMGAGLGPRHYTVHLRAVLLLQFMEHLDKLMYNAYEGSCVTLPPVPKVTLIFIIYTL